MNAERFISDKIQQRVENDSLRRLSSPSDLIDFCSNDYLGFGQSLELKRRIDNAISEIPHYRNGSGGSRLLSGNHIFTEQTEKYIAEFHRAENGLIFNSGYDANIGLLSSLPQRGDTIITDELIHASLVDGARLSHAVRRRFKHNDLKSLEARLKSATGHIYVVVESVYSMDGDIAPLTEIADLCDKYKGNLIVDEAHAIGVLGNHGQGLVHKLGLEKQVFARIITFGKALGCHGAIILGSNLLRQFLINFARSFIYTTAAPMHNIISVKCAYSMLQNSSPVKDIRTKIQLYRNLTENSTIGRVNSNETTIQTLLLNSSLAAKNASEDLRSKGFDIRPILSPTVPEGQERLRICLHTYNTDQEIRDLVKALKSLNTK